MTNDVQAPDDSVADGSGADGSGAGGSGAGGPRTGGRRFSLRRASNGGPARAPLTFWQELPLLVAVAVVLAVLVKTFAFQAFVIPTESMESTILRHDRVLVNKLVYDVRDPRRGEVVVFARTGNWPDETDPTKRPNAVGKALQWIGLLPSGTDFIKRVVGLPGDTVACCDAQDHMLINGKPLEETAYTQGSNAIGSRNLGFTGPVTVPPGYLFVMGDNREDSADSRKSGFVPIDSVVGRAFVVIWPASHWKGLRVPGAVEQFPGAAAAGLVLPFGAIRARRRRRYALRATSAAAASRAAASRADRPCGGRVTS